MIGKIFNERYKIKSELGQGGMGTVYRAHDEALNRDVAVKLMSNTKLGTEGRARLLNEAQTIAQLNHPNIVTVFDVGEFESFPYIVMELIEGGTLQDNPPQEFEKIVQVTRQICTALEHAHNHGIIHRDLKPDNIAFESDGTAKLMDFGLARSIASRLSTEGSLVGTVYYMAPEQAMGQNLDGRADLYALGVMLYQLTTSSLPFDDDDPIAIISQHIHAPLVPPRAKNGDIPPALNDLIEQLMSKEPADRPNNATDVLQILNDSQLLDASATPSEELSVLERIVRGRMVGRQKEFQQARTIWKKASANNGQLLLISGEPGIGKTRLTRETATHAEVSGGRALTSAAYAEGGAPYSAFGQIIRQVFVDGIQPADEIPNYVMADLLILAPDLAPRFPEISPNPKLEAQLEQVRIFENITAFFRLLSTDAPLLIVVEDVHWADSGTLLLLLHLARNIKKDAILLIANYREVELDEGHPFQKILLDLNREHLATRIKLARLSETQTSDLLASMFDDETTPSFLENIFQETEGNPFFIEEVCKALVETGKIYFQDGVWHRPSMDELEVPQSIRIAIQARIGKLDKNFQSSLNLAAVLGHEFNFEVLLKASPQDEDDLIDALEAAEKAQLIRANPKKGSNAFAFMHALIPSTIYDGINSLRRGRMHKRVAEALQELRPNDFEELAYHYIGAGDLEKALHYYQQAAQRAIDLYAFDAAIQLFKSALDLLEPDEFMDKRIDLLEQLGEVRAEFGEKIEAIRCFLLANEYLSNNSTDAPMMRLRMLRKIIETGLEMTFYKDFQEIQTQYDSAIKEGFEIIINHPAHVEIVYFLRSLANDALFRKVPMDIELSEKYALQAVKMADDPQAAGAKSAALGALSTAYAQLGNYNQIIENSEKRLEILQSHKNKNSKDSIEETNAYSQLGFGFMTTGKYKEALSYLIKSEKMAAKIQALREQVHSMIHQAFCYFQLDQWDQVLSIEEKWRELVQRFPNFFNRAHTMCFQIGLAATVYTLKGDFTKAAVLRKESNDIMVGFDGPPENWGTSNYI